MDCDTSTSDESWVFIRLGDIVDKFGEKLSGDETLTEYLSDQKRRGYTWFSAAGPSNGRAVFPNGRPTKALFIARGKIIGLGDVGDCEAREVPFVPDFSEIQPPYPTRFRNDDDKLWLRIDALDPNPELAPDNFVISSTGKNLATILGASADGGSQVTFGYIEPAALYQNRESFRSSSRRSGKTARKEVIAPPICPICFMQLPANGICDNCD